MSATVHQSFGPKPTIFRGDDPKVTFSTHWTHAKNFINQQCNGSPHIFKLGEAMHLEIIAEHKNFLSMDPSLLQCPSVLIINRLEKIAETVHKNNPWINTLRTFSRSSAVPAQDAVLDDIAALSDDILAYSLCHTKSEFETVVKFEGDRQPTAALEAIKLYFSTYCTFDSSDFRNFRSYQEMTAESYEFAKAKLTSFLTMTYPDVPRIHNRQIDILGIIILILEQYSMRSDSSPQHNIQQCISDYGVRNNDSPAILADTIQEQMHNAYKLNQTMDEKHIVAIMNRHMQQYSRIDPLIRMCVKQRIDSAGSLADILNDLNGLTVQHACVLGFDASLPVIAASSTTITSPPTTISPSTLHSRQKEAQQGLRPAAQHSSANRSGETQGHGDTNQPHINGTKFRFCHNYLQRGFCAKGKDCPFLHVENGAALAGQGYVVPPFQQPKRFQPSEHRSGDQRPSDSYSGAQNYSQQTFPRGGHQRESRFPRPEYSSSSQGHGDTRNSSTYRSMEQYPYRANSFQDRRNSSSARVGFADDQFRGQHQNPQRFQDLSMNTDRLITVLRHLQGSICDSKINTRNSVPSHLRGTPLTVVLVLNNLVLILPTNSNVCLFDRKRQPATHHQATLQMLALHMKKLDRGKRRTLDLLLRT